jgi:hypothetical protein
VIVALEAAAHVLNVVELHYQGSATGCAASRDSIAGAYDLHYSLDRGLHSREIEEDSLQPDKRLNKVVRGCGIRVQVSLRRLCRQGTLFAIQRS